MLIHVNEPGSLHVRMAVNLRRHVDEIDRIITAVHLFVDTITRRVARKLSIAPNLPCTDAYPSMWPPVLRYQFLYHTNQGWATPIRRQIQCQINRKLRHYSN